MKKKIIIVLITIGLIAFVIITSFNETTYNESKKSRINRNSKIEDIVFDDNKVNIYFFWGNGCPHCEDQFQFFERINDEYSKYYNLYCFEVWYNDSNVYLMEKLLDKLEVKVTGIPITIIGEKHFSGFGSSMEEDFKKAIIEQHNNNFDVYR